jgi:CHASE2 domain-containing sensor protein
MTRDNNSHTSTARIDAVRQSLVAFVGALTLSALTILVLQAAEVGGLLTLAPLDEQVVHAISQPARTPTAPLAAVPRFRKVVVIDFDDQTMDWALRERQDTMRDWGPGRSTPRDLIAEVVKAARRCASVVYLDFDLREPQRPATDQALLVELQRSELDRIDPEGRTTTGCSDTPRDVAATPSIARAPAPVIVNRMVLFRDQKAGAKCAEAVADHGRAEVESLRSIVSDSVGKGSVYFAHPYFHRDRLGYVRGVCPTLRTMGSGQGGALPLRAAAELAAAMADSQTSTRHALPQDWRPKAFQFYVDSNERSLDIPPIKNAFRHISAYPILQDGPKDLSVLDGAIVLIGTTGAGSEEPHRTALGPMPGVIVHANAVLQTQIGDVSKASSAAEILVKIVVAVALAGFHAWFYTYWSLRKAAGSTLRAKLARLARFMASQFIILGIACVVYLLLVPSIVLSEVSQFAVLVPIVVVASEVAFELIKYVQERVEHAARRLLGTSTNHPNH